MNKKLHQSGKLIIFSAPSGSGKSTLVRHLLSTNLPLQFSVSATSRPPRGREQNGVEYYFLSRVQFEQKIKENAFLEWEEVYEHCYYGTLISEVEGIWKSGKHVIFDMDVVGGLRLKAKFGSKALAIFVQPPDLVTLEKRLRKRGTDSEHKIKQRLEKAHHELKRASEFDCIVVNQKLEKAILESEQLVRQFLK